LTVKFSNFKVPAEARSLEFEHLSPVGKNRNTLIADSPEPDSNSQRYW
jgi:hypothetical protein